MKMKRVSVNSSKSAIGSKALIAGAAFALAFVFGSISASAEDLGSLDPNSDQNIEADVDSLSSLGFETQSLSDPIIHSYKHYWGKFNGTVKSTLRWYIIKRSSRVFVSCSEGHLGAARYTVRNVVPGNGFVKVWTDIGWGKPIRLYCDYLVIN